MSKERKDKLAWVSTEPKRTHFVWDGTKLLQEYTYKGDYTYIYTDQDSYEPLAQVFYNGKDEKQYLAYFHTDQIGMPREMTDQFGNLLWYGEYTAWGRLKKDERVYRDVHQPFRLQNQYYDAETGLHYNFFRYYEPDTGRFINQDPIGLMGGDNLYQFASNTQNWVDWLGLTKKTRSKDDVRRRQTSSSLEYPKHTKAKCEQDAKVMSQKDAQYWGEELNQIPRVTERHVIAFRNRIEKEALNRGVEVDLGAKGSHYYIYDAGRIIGFNKGQPTQYLRVEVDSLNQFHGHPISRERYSNYLERRKR